MYSKLNRFIALGLFSALVVLSGCTTQSAPQPAPKTSKDGVSEVIVAAALQCHSDAPGNEKYFRTCVKNKIDLAIVSLQGFSSCIATTEGCKPIAAGAAIQNEGSIHE
ncbi:hypothetical protein IFT48_04105 [Pseudomonas fluorescens]|uniref:hypothetical protein n=1 Tax=Pseudomonas TaxID=286 RepID=UPI0013CEDC78|nr:MULTISPECIES: hypothetical protein [Pseudomonas]MBD8089155.1 hypothetical protein [Pseudomonas fluorescens]MBD8615418.1 hypothetical protein [Pseudomonas putida]MBD8681929.1 hypothetical protein [Pseudomonas sp. CFBP 13719]